MATKAKAAKVTVEPVQCTGENCKHIIKGSRDMDFNNISVYEVMAIAVVAYLSVMIGVIYTLS